MVSGSHISRLSSRPLVAGLTRFCFGLAKKALLVGPMGGMADAAFDAGPFSLSTFSAWMGVIAFAFQIYFLFSAYADMAAGVVQVLGLPPEDAFRSPYQSDGITDFWLRWQLPLGGDQSDDLRTRIAIILTMLIGALWHGASWGLVIWAGIHGAFLAVERLTGKKSFYAGLVKPLRVAITFFILLIAWVFFRADTVGHATSYLAILFGSGPTLAPTAALLDVHMLRNFNTVHFLICALGIWAMPNTQTILRKPAGWKSLIALVLLACSVVMNAEFIRPIRQQWLTQFGGEGNETVHVGTGGWLFSKAEITALGGRGPLNESNAAKLRSSRDAILKLAARLKAHGIPLLLVPVPVKAMIYPEHLSANRFDAPVVHPEQAAIHEQLRGAGIDVIDLAPEMWRLKLRKQVFLQQDTHWTPDAMKLMAESIAKHIRTKYPQVMKPLDETPIVDARLLDRGSYGDLVAGLDVSSPATLFAQEQVTLVSIVGMDPKGDSAVTLLGDSFVNVFDDPALGFTSESESGEPQPMKAGFGNQLAVLLNQPLDVIAMNDGGAAAALQALAGRSDDELGKKKLVVLVLAASDLLAP